MLRLGFLYSLVMTLAGAPLLAENPEDSQQPSSVAPELIEPLLAEIPDEPQPTLAHPALPLELEPTPAKSAYQLQTASHSEMKGPVPTLELLRAKQQQLEQLQREVGAMQHQLGVSAQYQVQCVMAEVDLEKLRELDPEIQWDDQRLSLVRFLENSDQSRTVPVQQFRAIAMCLNQTGTMKTLMSPSLMASAGEPAVVMAGGELPQQIPGAEGTEINWRTYGEFFLAEVQSLGGSRVKIHAVPDHSRLDEAHSIKVQGHQVPGIIQRRMDFQDEMQIGQTLIRSVVSRKGDKPTCLLVGITVTAVEQPVEVAERPELVPIPDADTQKME